MTPFQKLLGHFGLTGAPFGRDVPAGGLFRHKTFVESLDRLLFAIEGRLPAILSAPPGIGKSILLGSIREELGKTDARFVYTPLAACNPFGGCGSHRDHATARTGFRSGASVS